ncbi:MAG: hypothetical protein ACD_46C00004G0006 [uncultured bacterium]|nr:MAG: hypothetical protein ACD_46C00004G0006 [uncultured bacterium]
MLRFKLKTIFSCLSAISFFAASSTLASSATPFTNPENNWQIRVAPYIWAINMNGTVITGSHRVHVNESFSDLLEHLNFAGMIWLDASKNDVDLFLNVVYAVLRNNVTDGPASFHAKNRFGITSGGLAYQIYKRCFAYSCYGETSSISISPYVGFRYTENDTTVNVDVAKLHLQIENNQYWTDPIIGARINYEISKAWSAIFAGDIGGTNASSQYSYNVSAVLGYSPKLIFNNTTFYIGYRLLDQHYTDGNKAKYFNWDMKLFGPLAGVAVTF